MYDSRRSDTTFRLVYRLALKCCGLKCTIIERLPDIYDALLIPHTLSKTHFVHCGFVKFVSSMSPRGERLLALIE